MQHTRKPASGLSRREFVRGAGAATLLGMACVTPTLGAATEAAPERTARKTGLVGSNIYGWGQYYQRQGKNVNDRVPELLGLVRDAGFDYLEVNMDTVEPARNLVVAELMKEKGLQPVTLYTGARLHDEKAGETVRKILATARICRDAGFFLVSCNPDPIGREKTDPELANQASAVKDLGQGLAALGFKLGLHQHLPEMANNAREFHHLFRNTDPKTVGWCYDVHWVWRGGIVPMDALKLYGQRVVSWHLRQSRNKVWYEILDSGDVDYPAVAKYAHSHGLPKIYTVELALENDTQVTREVVANHQLSRQYVKKVFGV